ncbi:hypothetical protein [Paenibacillus sp. UASWS1643]|uniref:hypothetical protein n=1 Tax=Paenibacillus sp. UASWS1643 TaxID=2580422 RepID=UPI001238A931|nr:hypothetical protein [Paenibacillus sp. UASWS1643]KAA8756538.1 hypothetical protein FE296_03590 [Paenibacillus sp. UASWS1643]
MEKTTVIEIGYVRDHRTGNFIVTLIDESFHPNSNRRRQQIVVLPGAFFHILTKIDRRSIANAVYVTLEQAADLGFIVSNFPTIVEAIA